MAYGVADEIARTEIVGSCCTCLHCWLHHGVHAFARTVGSDLCGNNDLGFKFGAYNSSLAAGRRNKGVDQLGENL